MKSLTLDITHLLGNELQSRFAVRDLKEYIVNTDASHINIDFSNVTFATRSFIDEYYNIFMKDDSLLKKVMPLNLPEDFQQILEIVKRTQKKKKETSLDAGIIRCETFDELEKVFLAL